MPSPTTASFLTALQFNALMQDMRAVYENPFGTSQEARLSNRTRLFRAVAACRDQLLSQQIPLVETEDGVQKVARSVSARFDDGAIDIRTNENRNPDFRRRRLVANLGPQAMRQFWVGLGTHTNVPPQALEEGVGIILSAHEDRSVTQVALTKPSTVGNGHPEHDYVHVSPGTLIRAQQSYPSKQHVLVHVNPDFYEELRTEQVRPDTMFAGTFDLVRGMLGSVERQMAVVDSSALALVAIGKPEAVDPILGV